MRSDDRFIEEIFEKEKAKRAEIKAARKRTVGICSSLALLFVIGLAIPSFMGIFSASKGFDAMESAPNGAYDIMADEDVVTPDSPDFSQSDSEGNKTHFNGEVPEDNRTGDVSDQYGSQLKGDADMEAEDLQETDDDSKRGKSPDSAYIYLAMGIAAFAIMSIVVALIIRKRKNNKDII